MVSTDFTQVTDGNGLACNTAHLDGVSQGKLMIDRGFLEVTYLVINDTEINMGQELSCNVSNFLMLHVILNGVVKVNRVNLTQLHVVYADAVVGQGLSMDVTDRPTHLQELLVESNCLLELTEVVVEDACAVIRSALIS